MDKRPKNNQPSFLRMFTLVGILFGTFVGCFEMYSSRNQSQALSKRILKQDTYQKNGLHFLNTHLNKLSLNNFDSSAFYQLNPDNNILKKMNESLENKNLLTSFIIKTRVEGYDLSYVSACVPLEKALSFNRVSYEKLIKNNLWPFITELNGTYAVHCCPKDQPACQLNNVIDENSKYVVQIFKYDPNMNLLTPILSKAEFGSVSSAGFFVFGNKHHENKIHGRFFTFFNECLSQKIIFGKSSKYCSQKVSFKSQEVTQYLEKDDFNQILMSSVAP